MYMYMFVYYDVYYLFISIPNFCLDLSSPVDALSLALLYFVLLVSSVSF